MEKHAFESDLRTTRRGDRLGAHPSCLLCGITTPEILVQAKRSLLEEHHVAGEVNDPTLTVLLCRNCHAEVTEGQRDAGVVLARDEGRHLLERVEAFLRGVGDFLVRLGQAACRLAEAIARLIRQLDLRLPDWRAIAEVPL